VLSSIRNPIVSHENPHQHLFLNEILKKII